MATDKSGKGKTNEQPTNESELLAVEPTTNNGTTDNAPAMRLRDLFRDMDRGGITFSPSDSDKVYDQNGVKSQKLASFLLSFVVGNAGIPGSIYKRTPVNGKPYAEAAFVGTRQASAIKCYDEASKIELNEIKHEIAVRFAAWRKANGITGSKGRVNTGVDLDD